MTDRHALPRAAGSIRLIGVKKNHRLSRWVAFLEVNMIRVMVNGAGGKMGREVVKAVHADSELTMVGGIDPSKAGQDV